MSMNIIQHEVKDALAKAGIKAGWWGPKDKENPEAEVVLTRIYINQTKFQGKMYVKFSNPETCENPELSVYIEQFVGGEDIKKVRQQIIEENQNIIEIIKKTAESFT